MHIEPIESLTIQFIALLLISLTGSKMIPIFSWIQMGKDLLLIRLRYVIRAWKISDGQLNILNLQ